VIADGHAGVLKVGANRHRDLSRARSQAAGRGHALPCELIAGGGATGIGHREAQRRAARKKLAAAVMASGTSITGVLGAGPVIAATVIADVVTVARFGSQDHFAACNSRRPGPGCPPASGRPAGCRCAATGVPSHAIQVAAITQIAHKHSGGRACDERKIAEGKTHQEALRCRNRRISDASYARPPAGARAAGPGGQPGNHSASRAAGSHPGHRLFGQAAPGPQTSLRAAAALTPATPRPSRR
jgi:hypothetical protein